MTTHHTTLTPPRTNKTFRNIGVAFALMGAVAALLPAIATLVIEQLLGWVMLAWGVAGIMFARAFKEFSEWMLVAAGFALLALVGLFFLIVPDIGASVMTAFLVAGFIIDGVLSILLGLRMSGQLAHWQWIVASGACAFVLGLVILAYWPTTSQWVLGFVVGLNFLSTGISLLFVARSVAPVQQ